MNLQNLKSTTIHLQPTVNNNSSNNIPVVSVELGLFIYFKCKPTMSVGNWAAKGCLGLHKDRLHK